MKILTNVQLIVNGGVQIYFANFLKYLSTHKNDLEIVGAHLYKSESIDSPYPTQEKFDTYFEKVNYPPSIQVLENANTLDEIKSAYKDLINSFKAIIDEVEPDIVWVNGTYFQPWALMIAAQELGKKVVVHFHGLLTEEIPRVVTSPKGYYLMEESFYHSDFNYIFPSDLVRNKVNALWGQGHHTNSHVIYNPVDLSNYYVVQNSHRAIDNRNIAFIGRWSDVKNPDYYIQLAKYSKSANLAFNFHMLTDLDKLEKAYPDYADYLVVQSKRPHSEMADFYASFGAIVSPSNFETFGGVPLEALMAGTPALITKNLGIAEIYQRLGLEDWIIDLVPPEAQIAKLEQTVKQSVKESTKKELEDLLSPEKLFPKFIEVLEALYQTNS